MMGAAKLRHYRTSKANLQYQRALADRAAIWWAIRWLVKLCVFGLLIAVVLWEVV